MGFSISARFNSKIHNAVHQLVYKHDIWQAALNTKGETSRRIKVTEITHLVDMTTLAGKHTIGFYAVRARKASPRSAVCSPARITDIKLSTPP